MPSFARLPDYCFIHQIRFSIITPICPNACTVQPLHIPALPTCGNQYMQASKHACLKQLEGRNHRL